MPKTKKLTRKEKELVRIKEVETVEDLYTEDRINHKGSVYIIKCREYFKVGHTQNHVKSRIDSLQIGNPYTLKLVLLIKTETPRKVEEEIHKNFIHKKLRGEWFELDEEDFIKLENFIRNYNIKHANNKTEKISGGDSEQHGS